MSKLMYNIYHNGEHIGNCCVQGMEQARCMISDLEFVPVEEDTQAQQSELLGQVMGFNESLRALDDCLAACGIGGF